ncbi:nitrogen regulatory protein DAL80 [Candidozyma auris]|nr:nitrogen regulatory protein DAL80 [[Candida] auris]
MSEIQRLPQVVNPNPVHPNAKTTTSINNGTTTTKSNISSPVCRNCKTQTTPLWRRDETGQVLCNACGLFLKLHGRPRPISLKTDTIKSRNRIKQPNFSKKHGTNTPELKSKDSRVSSANAGVNTANGGKKSPKPGRKRSPPPDFAVQPKHHQAPQFQHQHQHQHQQPQQFHQQQHQQHPPHLIHHLPGIPGSSTAIPSPLSHPARGPSHGHLPHHLHHLSGLSSSQVQSLHYPSSTPTQFAPGLQRITSPLMLSTTLSNARSVSSTGAASPKSSLSAAQAAGALENMSNVLGPSATFKGSSHEMNGVSLMGHSAKTPSSALKQESRILPGIPPSSAPSTGASTNVIASPSFGPQFHLDSPKRDNSQGLSKPSLPPLQSRTQNATSASASLAPTTSAPNSGPLPPIQSLHPVKMEERNGLDGENARVVSHSTGEVQSTQNTAPTSGNAGNSQQNQQSGQNEGHEQSSNRSSNNNNNNNGDSGNSNNNNDGNNGNNGNNDGSKKANDADSVAYENTLLKTRISELELVNDLYRTRIMELEAMEQAARLRESSMRRRLDEVIALQAQNAARQGDEGEEKKAKTDQ